MSLARLWHLIIRKELKEKLTLKLFQMQSCSITGGFLVFRSNSNVKSPRLKIKIVSRGQGGRQMILRRERLLGDAGNAIPG
jgi:hypothetical protein